jgi:hypothetical protein
MITPEIVQELILHARTLRKTNIEDYQVMHIKVKHGPHLKSHYETLSRDLVYKLNKQLIESNTITFQVFEPIKTTPLLLTHQLYTRVVTYYTIISPQVQKTHLITSLWEKHLYPPNHSTYRHIYCTHTK